VRGVVERQRLGPSSAGRRDVIAPLFAGVYGFLTVNPSRSSSAHSVLSAAVVGSWSRSSANVASGVAATSAFKRASCPANARRRKVVCFRGASDWVSRCRCANRWTHARLTPNVAATSSASPVVSQALNTRSRKSIEYGAAIGFLRRQKYHDRGTTYK
jgi:hypothetical protein